MLDRKTSTTFVQSDLRGTLDDIANSPEVRSNTMFQLCMMLARVSLETADPTYQQASAERLLGILRDKPASNVVRLFTVVSNDEDD